MKWAYRKNSRDSTKELYLKDFPYFISGITIDYRENEYTPSFSARKLAYSLAEAKEYTIDNIYKDCKSFLKASDIEINFKINWNVSKEFNTVYTWIPKKYKWLSNIYCKLIIKERKENTKIEWQVIKILRRHCNRFIREYEKFKSSPSIEI